MKPRDIARDCIATARLFEVHQAKMDLLRYLARYQYLDELAGFLTDFEAAIERLALAARREQA